MNLRATRRKAGQREQWKKVARCLLHRFKPAQPRMQKLGVIAPQWATQAHGEFAHCCKLDGVLSRRVHLIEVSGGRSPRGLLHDAGAKIGVTYSGAGAPSTAEKSARRQLFRSRGKCVRLCGAKRAELRAWLPDQRASLIPAPSRVCGKATWRSGLRNHGRLRPECVQRCPLPDREPVVPGLAGDLGQLLAFREQCCDTIESLLRCATASCLDEMTMHSYLRSPMAVDETGQFRKNDDLPGREVEMPSWDASELLFDCVPQI